MDSVESSGTSGLADTPEAGEASSMICCCPFSRVVSVGLSLSDRDGRTSTSIFRNPARMAGFPPRGVLQAG